MPKMCRLAYVWPMSAKEGVDEKEEVMEEEAGEKAEAVIIACCGSMVALFQSLGVQNRPQDCHRKALRKKLRVVHIGIVVMLVACSFFVPDACATSVINCTSAAEYNSA